MKKRETHSWPLPSALWPDAHLIDDRVDEDDEDPFLMAFEAGTELEEA